METELKKINQLNETSTPNGWANSRVEGTEEGGSQDGSVVKSALVEDLRSVPSSHVKWLKTTSNSSFRGITGFKPPGHPHSWARIHTKINLRKKAMK